MDEVIPEEPVYVEEMVAEVRRLRAEKDRIEDEMAELMRQISAVVAPGETVLYVDEHGEKHKVVLRRDPNNRVDVRGLSTELTESELLRIGRIAISPSELAKAMAEGLIDPALVDKYLIRGWKAAHLREVPQ